MAQPTVASRQCGKRAIFVSVDVIFQDGEIGDLSEQATAFFRFFLFTSMSALALAYFVIRYTHVTTVVLWYSGMRDILEIFS